MSFCRYWFFADGGRTLVAAADCVSRAAALRLANDYNNQPGANGPVDLITDNKDPAVATYRTTVGVPLSDDDDG